MTGSKYYLLCYSPGILVPGCKSHKDIPAEHLLGNTNWTRIDMGDPLIFSFQCGNCGEMRTYKKIIEKTLL